MQESRIKSYWFDLMMDRSRYEGAFAAREHMRLPADCTDLVKDIAKAGCKLAKMVETSLKVHTERYNRIIQAIVSEHAAISAVEDGVASL